LIQIKEDVLPDIRSNFQPFSAVIVNLAINRVYSYPFEGTTKGGFISVLFLIIAFVLLLSLGQARAQGNPPLEIEGFGGGKDISPLRDSRFGERQPSGQSQPSPQQQPAQLQQVPQQQPGQLQQVPQQQPGQLQQVPQQQPEEFQQTPRQQPVQFQQPSQQQTEQIQQSPQQPEKFQQTQASAVRPVSPEQPLSRIVSGKIKIEGVKTILTELLRSEVGGEWILKAYLGKDPHKIYLSNLEWSVKPDDDTFQLDSSDPENAVVRLKSKKNIWADPKLKMITKEYVFQAQAQGKSGGKITSIDSILFAQCSFPVEFYNAARQSFNYPPEFQYRFSLQKQNGEQVDYKEYDELGKMEVDLRKEFKNRVIFHWNENTTGKSTIIKLEIMENGKVLIEKTQKMTSVCQNITGKDGISPALTQDNPAAAKNGHPSLSWGRPSFRKLDNSALFEIVLGNFQIDNFLNINPNIFSARNYFLEARFYHKDFKEGKDPYKAFQANQFSVVAKILPPHIENRRISLRGRMDDFSRMGYVLEDNPNKWYNGYFKIYMIYDSIPMETVQKSSPYPCRYKYHEGVFSREYVFEMEGGGLFAEKDVPAADEKPEKENFRPHEELKKETPQADEKPEKE
jgi:hypothetical protein